MQTTSYELTSESSATSEEGWLRVLIRITQCARDWSGSDFHHSSRYANTVSELGEKHHRRPVIDSNDVMQSYYVACLQHLASNPWHGSSAETSSMFLVYCQIDSKSKLLVGLWLCGTRHNSYLPKHGRRVKSHLWSTVIIDANCTSNSPITL